MARYKSMNTNGFIDKINTIKRVMGLSTRELALLIRVTVQSMNNWMHGGGVSPDPHFRVSELYEASLMIANADFKFYPHMLDQNTGLGTIRELLLKLDDIKPAVRAIIGETTDREPDKYGVVSEDLARRIWNSLADQESMWATIDENEKFDIRNKLFSALASGSYMVIIRDSEYIEYSPRTSEWKMINEQKRILQNRSRKSPV